MQDAVFAALADPTRRHLYGQLAQAGPLTATALAADLSISRQAVSKHLGILAEAGMATADRSGRGMHYRALTEPLAEVETWISSVQSQWHARLGALGASLERDA